MNSTTRIVLIAVGIAVLGLAAGFGFRFFSNKDGASAGGFGKKNVADVYVKEGEFAWGVTVLTFPFPTYKEGFTATQMTEAKKLGVNYIRVDYLPSNPKAMDAAINAAQANNLKVVLVIPFGPKDIFTDSELEASTETYVSDIVKKYKGKVAVYQLATEVASVALANNAALHGIEKKDYPAEKLAAVTTWIKVASEAVKKNDPKAKRLVNDQWVHTGFFDNFFAAGGDFDILGWNWFSDMGTSMDTVVIDKNKNQKYELLAKIKSYDKPIWLTEINRRQGSQGGKEQEQASFIQTMGDYVKTKPEISGFFVFNLLEDQAAPKQERGYGILNATDDGKTQTITGPKPAFNTYQTVIKGQ